MQVTETAFGDRESLYEIHWENPSISPHQLCYANILQYFCHLSNPFYDRECNNEVIRMQGLSQDRLTTLIGVEFCLYHAQEPVLFVIRKQERLSPTEVMPLAYYYIINGIVRQAPDLSTLLNSRLHTVIAGLNKTIQTLAPCARFHPSDGSYSWEDPSVNEDSKSPSLRQVEENIATNPYQVHRINVLLNEWVSRFPTPQNRPVSTQATPQQAPPSQAGNTDHQTPDKRARLI